MSLLLLARGRQSIFGLHLCQFSLFLVSIDFLKCFAWLVIQNHEVTIADVEARQVITCVFGVKNVLVNDKGCSSRLWRVAPVNNCVKRLSII